MADVVLRAVTKKFGSHRVVEDMNLSVNDGEFVTLLGPSGCGKTTLLRMIAGLEGVDSGDIIVGGRRYNSLPAQKRNIAMVFQSYALFPHMTVKKNIVFGLRLKKKDQIFIDEKLRWVVVLLDLTGLEDRYPREISGGQRQRVALARALVLDPDVLLLDEPLSNLDAALRETAVEELKKIHRKVGKTVIYVTHNQIEAMTMSERIALINNGRIVQYDTPKHIYDVPATTFTAEFIGSPPINFYDGIIKKQDGAAGIMTTIGFVHLDKARGELAEKLTESSVVVGIRPQSMYYLDHISSRRFTDAIVDVHVELIENMGDRSLIIGKTTEGVVVRFLVTREEEIVPGRKVTVCVDGRSVHLFDPITRLNIFNQDDRI